LRGSYASSDLTVVDSYSNLGLILDSLCLRIHRFIVHRQLSAYSFYIDENLVVQLADFGRARAVVDDEFIAETDEQVWVKWAAPEVLRRHRYTTKSDVWALAVVFWEVHHVNGKLFVLRLKFT